MQRISQRFGTSTRNAVWRVLRELWRKLAGLQKPPALLVIDSLNALVNGVLSRDTFEGYTTRGVMLAVRRSFADWIDELPVRPTVIFTAERGQSQLTSAVESYLADTVVHLEFAPLTHSIPIDEDRSVSITGELLFCKVVKARALANQRRRSCYQFVHGKGLKFFPTYAASGVISLFHENRPRHKHIRYIRNVDMPSSYPESRFRNLRVPAFNGFSLCGGMRNECLLA